jgi:hypothetical protein
VRLDPRGVRPRRRRCRRLMLSSHPGSSMRPPGIRTQERLPSTFTTMARGRTAHYDRLSARAYLSTLNAR